MEDQPTHKKLLDVEFVTTKIGNHLWKEEVKSCFHMFGSWPAAAYVYKQTEESVILPFHDIDVSVTGCLDGPSDTSNSRMAVLDTRTAYVEGLGSTAVEFHWMSKSENPAQKADINSVSAGIQVCPPTSNASSSPDITWMIKDDFSEFAKTMTLRINDSAMATVDPTNVVRLFEKSSALELPVDVPAVATFKTAMTGKSLSPLYMAKLNSLSSDMRTLMMAVVDTYEVSTWAEAREDLSYRFTAKDDPLINLPLQTTAKLVDDWSLAASSHHLGQLALNQPSAPCMAIDNMHGEEKMVFADTRATITGLVTSCCIPTAATPLAWSWPPHMIATRKDWEAYRDPSCLSLSQDFLSNMPFGPTPCHCGSYAPAVADDDIAEWKVTDGGEHQLELTTSCASPADVRSTSSSAKSPKSVKAAKSAKSTK
mmetsp:Transcript_17813/g.42068  ORF Transcript_17813/g.42068 Transcript_17813/m.42068 type:complete len:425 (+) Transcript_17813:3-1277(+)